MGKGCCRPRADRFNRKQRLSIFHGKSAIRHHAVVFGRCAGGFPVDGQLVRRRVGRGFRLPGKSSRLRGLVRPPAAFMGCQCRKMVHPSHREPYRLAGRQVQGRCIGHEEFPPLPCGLALEPFGRAAERRHSCGVESCSLRGHGPVAPQGQRTKTVLLILRHTRPLSDYRAAGCHPGAWRMHHVPGI